MKEGTYRAWRLPRWLDFCICYALLFWLSWYLFVGRVVWGREFDYETWGEYRERVRIGKRAPSDIDERRKG